MIEYKGRKFVEISETEPLHVGDRIVITFAWLVTRGTYSRAAQWAEIESILDGRPDFKVISYINTEDFLDVEIEVTAEQIAEPILSGVEGQIPWEWTINLQPSMFGVVAAVAVTAVSIAAIVGAITIYLTKKAQYRLIEEGKMQPQAGLIAQTGNTAVKIGLVVLAILILPKLLE